MADKLYEEGSVLQMPDGSLIIQTGGKWNPVDMSAKEAYGVNLFDKGLHNALATPAAVLGGTANVAASLPALVRAGTGAAVNAATGQPSSFWQDFADSQQQFMQTPIGEALSSFPRPSADVGEAVRSRLGAIGPSTLEQSRERERARTDQARELFPRISGLGEFTADAGAVVMARKPAAQARSLAAKHRMKLAEKFANEFRITHRSTDPEVMDAVDDIATKVARKLSKSGQSTASAGLKIAEAGLEGAYLGALNSDDPFLSGAVMAGTQASGSLGLFLTTKWRSKLIPAVAASYLTHELWRTFAPGDQDFFESKDWAVRTAAVGLSLGVLGGATGSGRLGPFSVKHERFADALTAVPRAGVDNLFRQLRDSRNSGNPLPEMVLGRMVGGPGFFNEDQYRALSRAQISTRKDAFLTEISRLMRDSADFRSRIEMMKEEATPPEGAQPRTPAGPREEQPLQPLLDRIPAQSSGGAAELARRTPTQPIQRN